MAAADFLKIRSDHDWIQQVYLIPGKVMGGRAKANRNYTSADLKYTDSSLGGNLGLNPKPQFTPFADPRMPGFGPVGMSDGQGEYYSSVIDDNAEIVYFQFGLPKHNSLTGFFSKYYDTQMARLANTGDSRGFFFEAGYAIGFLLTLPLQAVAGLNNMVTNVVGMLLGSANSSFYYIKQTMALYWSSVSTIVNKLGVNLGIVEPPVPLNFLNKSIETVKEAASAAGLPASYGDAMSTDDVSVMNRLMPDIFRNKNGGIDIFAVSTRAQRLANHHHRTLKSIADASVYNDKLSYDDAIRKYIRERMDPPGIATYMQANAGDANQPTYLKYMNNYYKNSSVGRGVGLTRAELDADVIAGDKDAAISYATKEVGDVHQEARDGSLLAELEDGSMWVGFYVDHIPTTQMSVTNSTRKSDLEGSFNSTSSGARSKFFDFAHGNVGDGAIASMAESAFTAVKNLMEGGLASIGMGNLAGLGGSAMVDMPEFWEASTTQLPTSSFTISLGGPYGNKTSVMLTRLVPLAAILAGVMPLSTGKHSYTSPLLCRMFHHGKNNIEKGIIDSVTVTSGGGGIGWTVDNIPARIDITISVLNLDKLAHMPLSPLSGPLDFLSMSAFDEETAFTRYLACLSGLSLYDQYYGTAKLKLAWRQQLASFEAWMSPTHHAAQFSGIGPGRTIAGLFKSVHR